MKTLKRKFNGITVDLVTNDSFQVSEQTFPEGLTPEYFRNLPRVGINSKGMPIVADDDGKHTVLSWTELRNASETVHSSGSGSSTPKDQDWWPHLEGLLKAKGLPEETKAFLKAKLGEKEAFEKAKAEKELKEQNDTIAKVMKMTGKTEEQVKKMLGL